MNLADGLMFELNKVENIYCSFNVCFFLLVGSTFDSKFNNVYILHVQEDPAYNPFFALNKQSSMLYNQISINLTQVRGQLT